MKKEYKDLIVRVVCFFLMVGLIAYTPSCSSYDKKLLKATPVTSSDSAKFAKKSYEMFPIKERIIQGKPIIKTVVKEDTKKVNHLNRVIDSLFKNSKFLNELLNQVPDIDSFKKAIQAEVLKNCKPKTITHNITTTDTIQVESTAAQQQYKLDIEKLNKEKQQVTEEKELYKDKYNQSQKRNFLLWLVIAALLIYTFRKPLLNLISKYLSPIKSVLKL